MKIKAANGKELPARVVIAKSLKEMKRMILDSLNKEIGCSADRVLWIVTVPAIWSPGAKQIMREAATEVYSYVIELQYIILCTVSAQEFLSGNLAWTKTNID